MTPDEIRSLRRWMKDHGGYMFYGNITGFIGVLTTVCVAFSNANGDFASFQFGQAIIGTVATIGAIILPMIAWYTVVAVNDLIFRGRSKAGLTREAKRQREQNRRLAAEKQALELRNAQDRILDLERELEIGEAA